MSSLVKSVLFTAQVICGIPNLYEHICSHIHASLEVSNTSIIHALIPPSVFILPRTPKFLPSPVNNFVLPTLN